MKKVPSFEEYADPFGQLQNDAKSGDLSKVKKLLALIHLSTHKLANQTVELPLT